MAERPAHNRLVVGSNPAGPTTNAFLHEEYGIRDMLEVLLDTEGKRKLRLRNKTNLELFQLYEDQLALKHRSADALKSDVPPENRSRLNVRLWTRRKRAFVWAGRHTQRSTSSASSETSCSTGEVFTTLLEAKVLLQEWRREYNEFRPHSAKGYRPATPQLW